MGFGGFMAPPSVLYIGSLKTENLACIGAITINKNWTTFLNDDKT